MVKGKVTKMIRKLRYYFHNFMSRYNEALIKDALCPDLKRELAIKASRHKRKADEMIGKQETLGHIEKLGGRESLALKKRVS